ncbi:MAG TPA: polyhydroxyalkanoic acid system family protein [Thermoguttaceae bacterium]|nr:polyhydroxyalkanoic acid system family protein [Thermoguttaceae bacterium]
MPTLSVVVPHSLEQEQVVARLKAESETVLSSFGDHVRDFEHSWDDHTLTFRFTTFGMAVDGRVRVEPNQISTTASVPLAAMMFKGAIEANIRNRLEELLAPQS